MVGRCEFTYAGASELTINEIGYDALPRRMPKHPLLVQLLEEMRDEVTAHHVARQAEQEKMDLAQIVDYVGRTACAECHNEIFTGYLNSQHAHAVATLTAKEEQRNGLCLPCHTTGFNAPTGFTVTGRAAGLDCVGCEQCHGPGEVHIQLERGAELTGPLDGLNRFGLREVTEATCRECHVETTNPDFDYALKLPLIDHGTSPPGK